MKQLEMKQTPNRVIILEDEDYLFVVSECNYVKFNAKVRSKGWQSVQFCDVIIDKACNSIVKCRYPLSHLLFNGLGDTITEEEYLSEIEHPAETNKPKEHYLEF